MEAISVCTGKDSRNGCCFVMLVLSLQCPNKLCQSRIASDYKIQFFGRYIEIGYPNPPHKSFGFYVSFNLKSGAPFIIIILILFVCKLRSKSEIVLSKRTLELVHFKRLSHFTSPFAPTIVAEWRTVESTKIKSQILLFPR